MNRDKEGIMIMLPLFILSDCDEKIAYTESIITSYDHLLSSKVEDAILRYAVMLSLKMRRKMEFMKGFEEALNLLTMSRRSCCLKLMISPSTDINCLCSYIMEIALYGIEYFVHNYPIGVSSKVRLNKLRI